MPCVTRRCARPSRPWYGLTLRPGAQLGGRARLGDAKQAAICVQQHATRTDGRSVSRHSLRLGHEQQEVGTVNADAYSAIVTQIDVFVDLHRNALAALFQNQVFGADSGNQRLPSRYVNAVWPPFSERSGDHPTISINR